MVNTVTSLQSTLTLGRHGDQGISNVVLQEIKDFDLFQFAAWENTVETVANHAAQLIGSQTAINPRAVQSSGAGVVFRVEPLKWWLITPTGKLPLEPTLEVDQGVALNLLHSRSWIQVSGEKSATLLNQFLPIDLRLSAFPVGTAATTAFHHVGVTLWRGADGFNLLIPRSFAASLCELLFESAQQYGLSVQQPKSL
ncbi:sarcosine oxidase subunit gamma [Cochlodiniinecator piscidefendens]|uniref:sarcosine oxidase subunit gamma n=1 Tax=Cochlodiniinecator piscidefendens TaxID=2715756 RepID=UPI00140CFCF4|nr:sarcosine oxidase subunit gamma [Cochlodiniinecator piscidefendens]